MKLKIVFAALAAASGMLATSHATAQESKPVGLSIRAGLVWPTTKQARDEGQSWFGAGLDYKIGNLRFGTQAAGFSSSYGISADVFSKGDFSSVPVTLNYTGRQDQFYYSAGVGVAFVKFPRTSFETHRETKFAYQFSVGYDFNKTGMPIFVEARYFGNTESRLAAFGAFVGIRF